MMSFYFSMTSLKKLEGVHPDLVKVTKKALELSKYDFLITEGLRSPEKQKALFDAGKSQTLKSRHLTGHAIDFCALIGRGEVTWDFNYYKEIANAFKEASKELNIPIEWGGDWPMRDGPHVQLTWKAYP